MTNEPQVKPFDEIIPAGPVLEAVKKLGFAAPTPVQSETIPPALKGQDLIVQAHTGSGKTFAFAIPMLIRLQQAIQSGTFQRGTFGLIVSPTRELASQIEEVVRSITNEIQPACLIGGASINAQISALREDPRIVIGTPGRILDLLRQRELNLRKCQMFVLDEADEMLSMGFLEDVTAILSRLPDRRQGMLVSATITPRVSMLAGSFLYKPQNITIAKVGQDLPPINHVYYETGSGVTDKASALTDLIETLRPRSAIIFCNTKSDTETVEIFLRRRGFDARRINSDLSQKERNYIINKVKAQDLRFLVGTDIAARGLDIEELDWVINYALPDEPEIYMHRTGRTGRAGRAGTAISLVGPQDFMPFTQLKRRISFELNKLPLPTEDEVVQARAAHFYELIREAKLEAKERDVALARKILKELGGVDEPSEELAEFLAKMTRCTVEQLIKLESSPLEEEARRQSGESSEHRGDAERERPRGGHHRGGSRDRSRHRR